MFAKRKHKLAIVRDPRSAMQLKPPHNIVECKLIIDNVEVNIWCSPAAVKALHHHGVKFYNREGKAHKHVKDIIYINTRK